MKAQLPRERASYSLAHIDAQLCTGSPSNAELPTANTQLLPRCRYFAKQS